MPQNARTIVLWGCLLAAPVATALAAAPALPTTMHAAKLGRQVNPFIGTGGITYLCGNNFPGATVPFGMVRLSPDTASAKGRKAANTSGYYYRDEKLLGFSHTRLSGTGATDGGNFLVVPSNAPFASNGERIGLNTPYSHDKESAFPGYYAVELSGPGIVTELTATCRVGVHRYTFSEGQTPHLQIHVTSVLGKGRSSEGEVHVLADAAKSRERYGPSGRFPAGTVVAKSILSRDRAARSRRSQLGREKLFRLIRRRRRGTISVSI